MAMAKATAQSTHDHLGCASRRIFHLNENLLAHFPPVLVDVVLAYAKPIIWFVGLTGGGTTSLIHAISGVDPHFFSHNIVSTTQVQVYETEQIVCLDTPGWRSCGARSQNTRAYNEYVVQGGPVLPDVAVLLVPCDACSDTSAGLGLLPLPWQSQLSTAPSGTTPVTLPVFVMGTNSSNWERPYARNYLRECVARIKRDPTATRISPHLWLTTARPVSFLDADAESCPWNEQHESASLGYNGAVLFCRACKRARSPRWNYWSDSQTWMRDGYQIETTGPLPRATLNDTWTTVQELIDSLVTFDC